MDWFFERWRTLDGLRHVLPVCFNEQLLISLQANL